MFHRRPGVAKLLPGGSSWVELKLDCGAGWNSSLARPTNEQWASVRILELGKEFHPLSVALSRDNATTYLTALVSGKSGDWSRRLASLAKSCGGEETFEVEFKGPYPSRDDNWSFMAASDANDEEEEPSLLLIAGGTGIFGWLPGLMSASKTGRDCHLVWCVQREADYVALASRLPTSSSHVKVTVYITRQKQTFESMMMAGTNQQRVIYQATQSSRRRLLLPLASLGGACVGLAVAYWGWRKNLYLQLLVDPPQTIFGFTILIRCLPILLIVISMVAFIRLSAEAFYYWHSKRRGEESKEEEGTLLGNPADSSLDIVASSSFDLLHKVIYERPILADIIREGAAGTGTNGNASLVVASVGPDRLVRAVREAVVCVRGESTTSCSISFSGTGETRW